MVSRMTNQTSYSGWQGIINEYRQFLPVDETDDVITLHEGNTPLVRSHTIGPDLGLELYFKYEGANPTGSFKDRGMALAVTKAKARGAQAIICASTGNTSASAAAYAARAGLKAIVIVPRDKIALGKLAQALAYDAQLIAVDGNFDQALDIVRQLANSYPEIELVNSLNPYRIPGQRSGAFEVCDTLGCAPDMLAIPMGNAGNITAYWQGFKAYKQAGVVSSLPLLAGFQAEGAAPIVDGHAVAAPETRATAVRIGNPANWKLALSALEESSGVTAAISEGAIVEGYLLLAREGLLAEPASALTVAGLRHLHRAGMMPAGVRTVVAVLTGNGLKDPEFALNFGARPLDMPANLGVISRVVETWLR